MIWTHTLAVNIIERDPSLFEVLTGMSAEEWEHHHHEVMTEASISLHEGEQVDDGFGCWGTSPLPVDYWPQEVTL